MTYSTQSSNQRECRESALNRRDIEQRIRQAVSRAARQLMLSVPPNQRTPEQTTWLNDRLRKDAGERYGCTEDALVMVFEIARQSNEPCHALSSVFHELEVEMAAATPLCPTEASDAEDEANHPLNVAQKLWERERTPVRAVGVVEAAMQQLHKTQAILRAFIPLSRRTA